MAMTAQVHVGDSVYRKWATSTLVGKFRNRPTLWAASCTQLRSLSSLHSSPGSNESLGGTVIGSVALPARGKPLKHINFSLTVEELRLLVSLASDQLFRRQFIDPKMPGYKGNPEEVYLGKELVKRMRLAIDGGPRYT